MKVTEKKAVMSRSATSAAITRKNAVTGQGQGQGLGTARAATVTNGIGKAKNRILTRRSRSCSEITIAKNRALLMGAREARELREHQAGHATKENKPPAILKTITTTKSTTLRNNTIASKRNAPPAPAHPPPSKTMPLKNNTTINSTANSTVASKAPPKFAPYDFKGKYNYLLERHKALKEEMHQVTDDRDRANDLLEQMTQERDQLLDSLQQYKESDKKIRSLEEKCKSLQNLKISLMHRYDKEVEKRRTLTAALKEERFRLNETVAKLEVVSERLSAVEKDNAAFERMVTEQGTTIEDYRDTIEMLQCERRQLHNKIQDMKGNIRVICRVRPALDPDRPIAMVKFPDACTIELERLETGNRQRLAKYDFKFDRVFGPTSDQDDVWEEVSCLVQSAIDGYNVCIFAYGQTGSGKTYTMEGTDESPGVIPKTCSMLFEAIKQMSKSGWEYKVYASFLEIYNEQLFDLLQPNRDPRELDIRMVDAKGSDVYVTNMHEEEVRSALELEHLCARAAQRRQTAATASNERSSRSHSVARIKLVAYHKVKSQQLQARLCLVDLAGSESAKLSGRIEETKNINRSLSELGQVILALQQRKEHVPFRNSKLTRLLEPQLGGAAKALLVAAAAPYLECSQETLNTFRFATQVGNCSTAAARRNIALLSSSSSDLTANPK